MDPAGARGDGGRSEGPEDGVRGGGILRTAGAFDAMSAKLVELSGFDAVWAGSFAISATHALPDASILTMTEFLAAASRMSDACSIPVIADCDTGFGGPSNVSHMVKKYEGAGIAAVCIEDKVFPKQNSLLEGGTQELLPEKEFAAKLIAAREAKSDPDFMVIARTEALIAGLGTAEAVQRPRHTKRPAPTRYLSTQRPYPPARSSSSATRGTAPSR